MTTHVKEGIELIHLWQHIRQLHRVLPQFLAILQEVCGNRVVLEHLDGARVERCLAALGRGNDQLGLVLQDMVGVGKFGLFSLECLQDY